MTVTVLTMSNRTTKKWVVKSSYKGDPKREDLEIVEEELPPLKDGGRVQFVFGIVRTHCLCVGGQKGFLTHQICSPQCRL